MKKKDVATTYEQEVHEVEKQKKRDKIRRTIVFGVFGICVCVAVLILLVGTIMSRFTKIEYPASTLSPEKQESLVTNTYEDLTQIISFGPYYMCIPPKEVISATDETLIMKDSTHTYFLSREAATENPTLNADLPLIINTVGANTYNPQLSDTGYINTIQASYIAGNAKANGNLYFVAYELMSDTEKLEILITAKNQGNLNEAKDLLDRMVYTLILKEGAADDVSGVAEVVDTPSTEETETSERASDAPKALSRDGVKSQFLYDRYYTNLRERTNATTAGAYDRAEKAFFFHVQNTTGSLDYDRVYFEVTVSFNLEDESETYYGTDEAGCYLIDINSYEMPVVAVDRSFGRSITYVFECPNESLYMVNDYDIVIHDPLKKAEYVYFAVNEPKNCKYSPYYEEPDMTEGVQQGDTYNEDLDYTINTEEGNGDTTLETGD